MKLFNYNIDNCPFCNSKTTSRYIQNKTLSIEFICLNCKNFAYEATTHRYNDTYYTRFYCDDKMYSFISWNNFGQINEIDIKYLGKDFKGLEINYGEVCWSKIKEEIPNMIKVIKLAAFI